MKKTLRTAAALMTLVMLLCCFTFARAEENGLSVIYAEGHIELGSIASTEGTIAVTLKQSAVSGYEWRFGNDASQLLLVMDETTSPTEKEEMLGVPGMHRFVLVSTMAGSGIVSFWFSKTWIHGYTAVYTLCIPYTVDQNLRLSCGSAYVLESQAIPDSVEEQMASDPAYGSITFKSDALELYVGKTATQTVKASSSAISKKGYTYESSDPAVATVGTDGRVKGISQGSCIIQVKSKSDENVWARYIVRVMVPVSKVNVTAETASMLAGEQLQLTASVEPANADNQAVTWTSSDKKIATVDEKGVVTAIKRGTVTITAHSVDNKNVTGKYKISVVQTVTGVTVEKQYVRVGVGYNATVTAKIQPTTADNKNMTWYSSNESICTVSGKKNEVKLVGRNWGECTITGVTEDGNYTCSFTALVGSMGRAVRLQNPGRNYWGAPVFTLKNDSNLTMRRVRLVMTAYDHEGNGLMLSNGSNPYVFSIDYSYTIDPFSSVNVDFSQVYSYVYFPWSEISYMQIAVLEWESADQYTTSSGGLSNHYSFDLSGVSWVDFGTPVVPVNDPEEVPVG